MNHKSNKPTNTQATSASQSQLARHLSTSGFAVKTSFLVVAAAAASIGFSHPAHAVQPVSNQNAAESWAPGRILVVPRAGLPEKELAKILAVHGGKGRKIGQSSMYIVDLPGNGSEKDIAAKLSQHPHLKFAEIDRRVAGSFVPNDPYNGSEYHLTTIGAPAAWDSSQGAGITIAILDSGVDPTHPDLVPNLVAGYNFYDNNTNTADVNGHGTAVAGAAAAASNNGIGVAGVAGQAKIMPVRIADANAYAYYSTIAQGLTWAADHGARVANISYGGVAGSPSIQSAAQYMKSKGGLVVVSAGNNGINETTAPTTTMIPVSATDSNDALASWSSYGSFVAVSAPGVAIWSTSNGSAYGQHSGTSFSAPITAGAVALAMSANTTLDGTQVESMLYSTAKDLGTAGRDIYFGYGRVNAAGLVQAAVAAKPVVDTQAPTASISAPLANATVSGLVAVNANAADNVGVARVELKINGNVVAVDNAAPFAFSWDSSGVANGMASIVVVAYDAAGNATASAPVSVNVSNTVVIVPKDTTPPVVAITNPVAGSVSGTVTVSVNASDNSGAAGITQSLYIDGALKATGTGSTLGYSWNTRKVSSGAHTIQVVAKDAAGNTTSSTVQVSR
ncbi:MAG: S8 family serine peptidase [Pseudomonadota bacterium]